MQRFFSRFGVLSVLLTLVATTAHAHGGAPAALRVVAATGDDPKMVLLNEGLAVSHAGRWSFLCPRLWGDMNTASGKMPLAMSVDGPTSWIIGTDDLYAARDGVLTAQQRPDLNSGAVIAVAVNGDALFGLRFDRSGSALVRIDVADAPVVFAATDYWSEVASEDGLFYLGRYSRARDVTFSTVDRTGAVLAENTVVVDGVPEGLQLRPTAHRLFAVVSTGSQYTLGELASDTWHVVAKSPAPIHGPVASAKGPLWIAVDGELMRATSEGFAPVGEPRTVTCLDHWGSLVYACVGSELYRLTDDGVQARLFTVDALGAPDAQLVPEPASEICDFQWLLFRNDLERSGLLGDGGLQTAPADAGIADSTPPLKSDAGSPPPRAQSHGCNAVPVRSAPWPAVAATLSLALLIARRARVRRRPG